MLKKILLAIGLSLIASSAWATCGAIPLTVKDASNATQNISSATAADGNCKTYIDADTSSQLHTDITSATPAGTNTIGNVNGAPNLTATDCSGSVTTGNTAQNAFTAQTTLHGFTIVNIDTTEPLWISFTTTAAASTAGSYPLQAATATTFASPGSFTTPMGFGANHALSVIAATTGHKWSCTWW